MYQKKFVEHKKYFFIEKKLHSEYIFKNNDKLINYYSYRIFT